MQWLRLHTPFAGGMGLIHGQESKLSHGSQCGQKKKKKNLQLYLLTTVSLCGCSVVHLCLTLCFPMDRSPPGSSVRGILQARILGWVAFPPPGDLPDPGTETSSLLSLMLWQVDSLPTVPPGKPHQLQHSYNNQ